MNQYSFRICLLSSSVSPYKSPFDTSDLAIMNAEMSSSEHGLKDDLEMEKQPDETKPLSKNQQRKLRRQEAKLKYRPEKRRLERERKKEKRKQALSEGQVLPPCRKMLRKNITEPIDINVVIDSSFEEYMNENDIKKLVKQIQHCYAINRRASQPFKYHVSSYGGKMKNIIEGLSGTSKWNVHWSKSSYGTLFDKDDIVYLSAESNNVLTSLEEGKAYIIGGLVDHNSKKGLCHELAVKNGFNHAQLPISQYIDMKSRKVLTIDHVFEILLRYHEQKDWESAFFSVIPKRKGAQAKVDPGLTEDNYVPDSCSDESTEPTGDITTKPPSDLTTEPPSNLTTEPPSYLNTEPPTDLTTEPPSDLTTEPSNNINTESSGDVNSRPLSDVTIESPTD